MYSPNRRTVIQIKFIEEETFEGTKEVFRSRKSKTNRQCNGQTTKDKRTMMYKTLHIKQKIE
jgi:hypothetical protein